MYTEMKLMDLARRVYEMDVNDVIDFSNNDADDADRFGGWCGIKRINMFDSDNLQFLIGHYGGECNVKYYAISEYDEHIGDFCEGRLTRYVNGRWVPVTGQDYVECIAKMIADFLLNYDGSVNETITVDEEV